MGIIRNILVVLSFLFVCSLSAQTVNDTIVFEGDTYVKHIVKGGESLRSIAQLHKISISTILDHNEIQRKLFYNQLLYIPIYPKKKRKKEDKSQLSIHQQIELKRGVKEDSSVINIALLLPFYVTLNDILIASFEDPEDAKNIIYKKSALALSFLQGVEIAVDSLRSLGKNIHLHIFDTANDTLKVQQIIVSRALDSADIIIGPLYSRNMILVSNEYGQDTAKIIISPLSKNTKFLKGNRSTFQINSPFLVQSTRIRDFIMEKYRDKTIHVLVQQEERNYALYIRELFKRNSKPVAIHTITSTHVDTLRMLMEEEQCVIIPSYNQVFVSKILSSLGGIDSSFVVFGLNNWKKFDNLDTENLMQLRVHIPDPYYFDIEGEKELSFIKLYEQKYKASANQYSFIGYNLILHFCTQNKVFKFSPYNDSSGMINTHCPIILYKDFSLLLIDY